MNPKPKYTIRSALIAACAGSAFIVAQSAFAAATDTVVAAISEQTKTEAAAVASQKKSSNWMMKPARPWPVIAR